MNKKVVQVLHLKKKHQEAHLHDLHSETHHTSLRDPSKDLILSNFQTPTQPHCKSEVTFLSLPWGDLHDSIPCRMQHMIQWHICISAGRLNRIETSVKHWRSERLLRSFPVLVRVHGKHSLIWEKGKGVQESHWLMELNISCLKESWSWWNKIVQNLLVLGETRFQTR